MKNTYALFSKPQTPNPKLQTPNSKPQTPNLKPKTQNSLYRNIKISQRIIQTCFKICACFALTYN